MKKKLATVMAATMAVSGSVVSVNAATTEDKIVGSNRTDTAVRISKEGWKSAETVILVNDSAIPDALTATPLAHAKNAPILLTGKNGLNKATADEIKRLGAKDVIMIGGDAVLSANVEKDLKALNIKVDRVKGATREETALAIAKRLDGIKDVSEIAVVNGTTGLADAVSVAAAAAERNMPILLANPKKGLTASEKFIKDEAIKASFVIGGKTALPEKLVSSLPGKQRIEGSDRKDTNAKVIEKFYTGKELNNVYLAKDGMGDSGQLIDALAVGALAAKNGAPVLIASKKLSAAQVDVINTKKIDTITQVGGKGNEGAFNQLKDIEEIDVYEVGTVEELKEALAKANANDKIVLKPNATITEDIIINTDKNVDIKVEGTVTGKVEISAPNGNVTDNSTSKPSTGGGSTGGIVTPPSKPEKKVVNNSENISTSITSWYEYEGNKYLDTSATIDFDKIKITDIESIKFELMKDDEVMGSGLSTGNNLVTLFRDCNQYWNKVEGDDGWKQTTGKRALSNAFKQRDKEEDNGFWVRSSCTASPSNKKQPNKLRVTIETSDTIYINTGNFKVEQKKDIINNSENISTSITSWYEYEGNKYLDTSATIDFDKIKITDIESIKFELMKDDEVMGSGLSTGNNLVTLFKDCNQYWNNIEGDDGWKQTTGKRALSNAFKQRDKEEDNGFWVRSSCTASPSNEKQPNKLRVTIETKDKIYINEGNFTVNSVK